MPGTVLVLCAEHHLSILIRSCKEKERGSILSLSRVFTEQSMCVVIGSGVSSVNEETMGRERRLMMTISEKDVNEKVSLKECERSREGGNETAMHQQFCCFFDRWSQSSPAQAAFLA